MGVLQWAAGFHRRCTRHVCGGEDYYKYRNTNVNPQPQPPPHKKYNNCVPGSLFRLVVVIWSFAILSQTRRVLLNYDRFKVEVSMADESRDVTQSGQMRNSCVNIAPEQA